MTVIVTNVKKLVDFLTLAASLLAATGLAMIVCSYIYEVVSRYVFQSPTAWASDFVAYALCASAFLALPHVTKDKAHVAVTILVDIAPKPIANILHVIISILGFLCLSFAAWVSLQENIRQFSRGIHTLAIVPIPQWWVSSFITFGLGLSAIYLLLYLSPKHRASGIDTSEQAD
jgi:TRAP-type C4-dicarboxylate transport system permease small subunit